MNNLFKDISIEQVHRRDLPKLETVFFRAFGDEIHIGRLKNRIRRIRQFYYILLPLRYLSMWVKNLFSIYVVKVKDQVLGFIQVSYMGPKKLHIDYIAISKKYRGKGVGSWVLRRILEKVADKKDYNVVLEVGVDNPAYNLYKRLGFSEQGRILHYERPVHLAGKPQDTVYIPGFRRLTENDRTELCRLYRLSTSRKLLRVTGQGCEDLAPNMFIRSLEWFKDRLMQNAKHEYIVKSNGELVAMLLIRGNRRYKEHVIQLIVHPDYEEQRENLLRKALSIIAENHGQGRVSITVYDDKICKQKVLEQLGFKLRDMYYLMYRPPKPSLQQVSNLGNPKAAYHQKSTGSVPKFDVILH